MEEITSENDDSIVKQFLMTDELIDIKKNILSTTAELNKFINLLQNNEVIKNNIKEVNEVNGVKGIMGAAVALAFGSLESIHPEYILNRLIKDLKNKAEQISSLQKQYFMMHTEKSGELETQIAALLPKKIASSWNDNIDLSDYDLPVIEQSVWQYAIVVQRWLDDLKVRLDQWAEQHADWLATAESIRCALKAKLPPMQYLSESDSILLIQRRASLLDTLQCDLTPTLNALQNFKQQAQALQVRLKSLNSEPNSLALLAQSEQIERPTFSLFAEHTARLCTDSVRRFEWLGEQIDLVRTIIAAEEKNSQDYITFTEASRRAFLLQAQQDDIDSDIAERCFQEWEEERRKLLQLWLPLVQAGLDGTLQAEIMLAVLDHLEAYCSELDRFYRNERLPLYIKYSQPGGNRLEVLETTIAREKCYQSLSTKLCDTLFKIQEHSARMWLVNFVENWQQGILDGLESYLARENLTERTGVATLITAEMHDIRNNSLSAALQDAQAYAQALDAREKSFNTLMFKMRKALSEGV